ncbi:MAG TPA: acyltransferase, partial [Chitinophaga sp.]
MKQPAARSPWIDYLRSFITVLVVAHHAALAYTSFAVFNRQAYILSTHPVVDTARCGWLDFPVMFNDTYFMALMFLLSGLFAGQGLLRKGRAAFLRDRVYRLLLPFVAGVTLLMPLAYYPAWLGMGKPGGMGAYLADFFSVEAWPVGPPWFLWVLFLFNALIALFREQSLRLFRACSGCLALPAVFTGLTLLLY